MEIKINKEIRSYKETVYFGLTGLAVHRGRCAYGGSRLLPLQRPDAGAIPVGVVQDQFPAGRSAAVAQRELPI